MSSILVINFIGTTLIITSTVLLRRGLPPFQTHWFTVDELISIYLFFKSFVFFVFLQTSQRFTLQCDANLEPLRRSENNQWSNSQPSGQNTFSSDQTNLQSSHGSLYFQPTFFSQWSPWANVLLEFLFLFPADRKLGEIVVFPRRTFYFRNHWLGGKKP